jgi:hypothetical protein
MLGAIVVVLLGLPAVIAQNSTCVGYTCTLRFGSDY